MTDTKLAFYRGTLIFGKLVVKAIFKQCKAKAMFMLANLEQI